MKQRGFSLVELMVAMTIGLFLTATLGYVFLSARTGSRGLEALSRMQENARLAFDTMGTDIRMTGFTGGPFDGGSPVNAVQDGTASATWDPKLKDLYGQPLIGYEQDEASGADISTFPTFSNDRPRSGGDALTVVRADQDEEYAISTHAEPDFSLSFTACPSSGLPAAGEIFVASDYTHSAVFQVKTAGNCAAGAQVLNYGTGTVTPGNSTAALGPFAGGAIAIKLYRLRGATYYIATNPWGEPALYRFELGHSGTTANATPVEVIEGVEDMQVTYGEDADPVDCNASNPQLAVTTYRTADDVACWNRVLSVRITLSLVSRQDAPLATTGGGLLRKDITSTIAVRNRLLP